jgi:hypothetical protein
MLFLLLLWEKLLCKPRDKCHIWHLLFQHTVFWSRFRDWHWWRNFFYVAVETMEELSKKFSSSSKNSTAGPDFFYFIYFAVWYGQKWPKLNRYKRSVKMWIFSIYVLKEKVNASDNKDNKKIYFFCGNFYFLQVLHPFTGNLKNQLKLSISRLFKTSGTP